MSSSGDNFLAAVAPAGGGLELSVIRTRAQFERAGRGCADRIAYDQAVSDAMREQDGWTLPGFCQVCRVAVAFAGDWLFSTGDVVNFRERLVCPQCELNNRQRFMAHLVGSALHARAPRAPVYLYEQTTPFYAWARRSLAVPVVGSEYLGHDVPGGAVIDGVRHEDALALSFETASLDVVVSNDVFEHVPDIDAALTECARVLTPGGRLFFSIPFHSANDGTTQRAALHDGVVEELLPPQYHGNPISPGGSLVFYDHGWDILDRCRRSGFSDAYLLGYWSPLYGYLGNGLQMVFVADRAISGAAGTPPGDS